MHPTITQTELKAISAMIPFVIDNLGTELQTRTADEAVDFTALNQKILHGDSSSLEAKDMKMIHSILNEVCNGISVSDEDFLKMFGMTRAEAEAVGEKIK